MSWSSAKNFKGYYYLLLCCIFDRVCSELFLGTSANAPGFCSEGFHKFVDGSWFSYSLVQKRGGPPFGSEKKVKNATFFNGQVLLWNSWIWEDSQSCAMGISWKGETLRNCFFCFYNSVLREISTFKTVVLLKIRMRLLPVTVGDALGRNVRRVRRGAGQKKAVIVWLPPDSRCSAEAYLPSLGGLFPKAFKWLRSPSPSDFQSCAKHCCRAGFASSSSDYP